MNSRIERGTHGGAPFDFDQEHGELLWGGASVMLMRIDLVNRIFGSVMAVPMFSTLLSRAAKEAGEDYALSFLLGSAPPPQGSGGDSWASTMPDGLRAKWNSLNRARELLAANPGNAALEAEAGPRGAEMHVEVGKWLNSLPEQMVRDLWQRMHAVDIYAGWGKTDLVSLQRNPAHVTLRVTDSFIPRAKQYWKHEGFQGKRVCSFFEGYFLGEAQVILGRDDLVCVEQACRMEGAPTCDFTVKRDTSLPDETVEATAL